MIAPVLPAGSVWPSPVTYIATVSPLVAALLDELRVKLALTMTAGPVPPEYEKIPGAEAAWVPAKPLDVWPRYLTTTGTLIRKTGDAIW